MSKKVNEDGLDASFIISQAKNRNRPLDPYSPAEEKKEDIVPEPEESSAKKDVAAPPKEDSRKRKGKSSDYESLFIRNAPTTTRSGKAVYIRKEFHDRIMRIVQVIGYNELSLFSYIDNVLEHHFNTYQEDISELYKKRNPDIF